MQHSSLVLSRLSFLLVLLVACSESDEEEPPSAIRDEPAGASGGPNVRPDVEAAPVDCGEPWPAEWANLELRVFELVNEVRATGTSCGGQAIPPKPELEQNALLVCTARAHSKDMGDRNYFEHDAPEGTSPFDRMTSAGYEWSGAAENIAMGQATPEAVMATWLDSPAHCGNIMGDYVHLGVGYYGDGEAPLWTQNFGSP